MGLSVLNNREVDCLFSDRTFSVCSLSLPASNLKTVYRKNLKVRANPKTHIGIFFAQNDPIYHQEVPSNYLFYKEVFALTQSLRRGGRILLTLRLYTNQDAGNILWEYAFEYLLVDTTQIESDQWVGECMQISADDPVVDLYTMIPGYADRENQFPYVINWGVEDVSDASLSETSIRVDEFGFTNNTLTMPNRAGAQARVVTSLDSTSDTKAYFQYVCVEPGVPSTIALESQVGDAYMYGVGEKTYRYYIQDQWGNPVKDNTVVDFVANGDFLISESQELTENGYAEVTVKGAELIGAENLLNVYVSSYLSTSVVVDILPISVSLVADSVLNEGDMGEVIATTSPAIANIPILLASDVGILEN
jgi:hypothetical protein